MKLGRPTPRKIIPDTSLSPGQRRLPGSCHGSVRDLNFGATFCPSMYTPQERSGMLCLGLREGCGDGVCAISSWKDASIPGRSCIPRRLSEAPTPRETRLPGSRPAASPPRGGRDTAAGTPGPAPPGQDRAGQGRRGPELRRLPARVPSPRRGGSGAGPGRGRSSRRRGRIAAAPAEPPKFALPAEAAPGPRPAASGAPPGGPGKGQERPPAGSRAEPR